MAKRRGKVAPALEQQSDTYIWNEYEDGTGHMETDLGHVLFEYDTKEDRVRSVWNGQWGDMGMTLDSWKENGAFIYKNTLQKEEQIAHDMAKHGVWYPTYLSVAAPKDGCDDVFIDNGVLLPMSEFETVVRDARKAGDDWYEDVREQIPDGESIQERDVAGHIRRGFCEPDERGIGSRFEVFGRTFVIPADRFIQVPLHDPEILQRNGMPVPEVEQNDMEIGG